MKDTRQNQSTVDSWENEGGASESGLFRTAEVESELATEFERALDNLELYVLPAKVDVEWAPALGDDARQVGRALLGLTPGITANVDAIVTASGMRRGRVLAALLELKKEKLIGMRIAFEDAPPPSSTS